MPPTVKLPKEDISEAAKDLISLECNKDPDSREDTLYASYLRMQANLTSMLAKESDYLARQHNEGKGYGSFQSLLIPIDRPGLGGCKARRILEDESFRMEELFYNRDAINTLVAIANGKSTLSSERLVRLLNYHSAKSIVVSPHDKNQKPPMLGSIQVIRQFVQKYREELIDEALEIARFEGGNKRVAEVKSQIIGYEEPARGARR